MIGDDATALAARPVHLKLEVTSYPNVPGLELNTNVWLAFEGADMRYSLVRGEATIRLPRKSEARTRPRQ